MQPFTRNYREYKAGIHYLLTIVNHLFSLTLCILQVFALACRKPQHPPHEFESGPQRRTAGIGKTPPPSWHCRATILPKHSFRVLRRVSEPTPMPSFNLWHSLQLSYQMSEQRREARPLSTMPRTTASTRKTTRIVKGRGGRRGYAA